MTLQKTVIDIGLDGGLRQEIDASLLPPGQFLALENFEMLAAGRITKRRGYQPLPVDVYQPTGGPAELPEPAWIGTLRARDELLACTTATSNDAYRGANLLHAWLPSLQQWAIRRPLPPFTWKRTSLARSAKDLDASSAQLAVHNGLRCCAWIVAKAFEPTMREVRVRIDDAVSGSIVYQERVVSVAAVTDSPTELTVLVCDDSFVVVWMSRAETGSIHTDFRAWRYNTTTYVGDATASTVITTSITEAGNWDAAALTSGTFGIIWIAEASPSTVRLATSTLAFAVTTAPVIAGSHSCKKPALHSNGLYVATGWIGSDRAWLTSLTTDLATVNWGPSAQTAPGADVWTQVTVFVGGDSRHWAIWQGQIAATDQQIQYRAWTSAGVAQLVQPKEFYHQALWSRPFELEGDIFLVTGTYEGNLARRVGFPVVALELRTNIYRPPAVLGSIGNIDGSPRPRLSLACTPVWDGPSGERAYLPIFTVSQVNESDQADAIELSRRTDAAGLWCACEAQGLLILTGGQTSFYDGRLVAELGFLHAPKIESLVLTYGDTGLEGAAGDGNKYLYRAVYAARDAAGNIHYSAPSEIFTVTIGEDGDNTHATVALQILTTSLSSKDEELGYAPSNEVFILLYRTEKNSTGPFYQLTWPASLLNAPQLYRLPAAYTDTLTDAQLLALQLGQLYTTGGVIADGYPPPSRHACVHKGRVWLVDAEHDRLLWYSKILITGEAPRFALPFTLAFDDSPDGLVAVASIDGWLAAFSGSRVYAVEGEGPGDQGKDGAFVARLLSTSAGCVDPRSVVTFEGGAFFQSADGLQLLTREGKVEPVGQAARDVLRDFSVIRSAVCDAANRRLIWVCGNGDAEEPSSRVVVFDYQHGTWYVWKLPTTLGEHAGQALWHGLHWLATIDGVLGQGYDSGGDLTRDGTAWVTARWRSAPIHLGALGGYQRIWRVVLIGKHLGAAQQIVRFYIDDDETIAQEEFFDLPAADVSGVPALPLVVGVGPQSSRALSVEVVDAAPIVEGFPATRGGCSWHALSLEAGVRKGAWKGPKGNTRLWSLLSSSQAVSPLQVHWPRRTARASPAGRRAPTCRTSTTTDTAARTRGERPGVRGWTSASRRRWARATRGLPRSRPRARSNSGCWASTISSPRARGRASHACSWRRLSRQRPSGRPRWRRACAVAAATSCWRSRWRRSRRRSGRRAPALNRRRSGSRRSRTRGPLAASWPAACGAPTWPASPSRSRRRRTPSARAWTWRISNLPRRRPTTPRSAASWVAPTIWRTQRPRQRKGAGCSSAAA